MPPAIEVLLSNPGHCPSCRDPTTADQQARYCVRSAARHMPPTRASVAQKSQARHLQQDGVHATQTRWISGSSHCCGSLAQADKRSAPLSRCLTTSLGSEIGWCPPPGKGAPSPPRLGDCLSSGPSNAGVVQSLTKTLLIGRGTGPCSSYELWCTLALVRS